MGKLDRLSLRIGKLVGLGRPETTVFAVDDNSPPVKRGDLFGWASLADNFKSMTYVQDPDVVLRKLKKTRADLELLLTDPDIKQAVNTRLDALVSTPFRLDPSEGELPEFIWENLSNFSPRILECAFLARLYGFSVAERVYGYDAQGRIVLRDIKPCDLRKFRLTPEDRLEISLNGIWQPVNISSKFLLTRCSPTVTNPYGDSLLTSLYWTWKFKNDSQRFMMQYLERCGIPMIVGKTDRGVKDMAVALKQAYQDAILTIDLKDDVQMLGGSNKSGDQAFIGVDNMFTKKILIMVLGQTLTTTTDGSGSRALGEVQDKVRMDKRDSDIRLCLPSVQNVVNALVWLNWEATVDPPRVSYEDNKGLESDRASRDVSFLKSGQLKFTRRYYTDKYDFSDEDFILKGEGGFGDSEGGNAIADGNNPAPADVEPDEAAANVQEAAGGRKMALAGAVYQFAAQSKFTRDEAAIEKAVTELSRATVQEFDAGAVVDAVLSAESGEDLLNRLMTDVFALNGGEAERPELMTLMLDAHIYGRMAQ